MKAIKMGDPQPVECKECGMVGYTHKEMIQHVYVQQYDEEGNMLDGFYADSARTINDGKRAYCIDCDAVLPFKFTS